MNKRFPFPKKYWVYLCGTIVFGLLLILNIYRTDSWTGDKPFSEFAPNDWNLFFIFILEEVLIFVLMILFAFLGGRISRRRNDKIIEQWNIDKYSGIKPGDYDYIWFDFDMTERALILKDGDTYKIASIDAAEDGERYEESIKKMTEGFPGLYEMYFAGDSIDEKVRKEAINDYVLSNGLGIDYYKDYGWDPVPLN